MSTQFKNFIKDYLAKNNLTNEELGVRLGYKDGGKISYLKTMNSSYKAKLEFRNALMKHNMVDKKDLDTLNGILEPKNKLALYKTLIDMQMYYDTTSSGLCKFFGVSSNTATNIMQNHVSMSSYIKFVETLLKSSSLPRKFKGKIQKASYLDSLTLAKRDKKTKIKDDESEVERFFKSVCCERGIKESELAKELNMSRQAFNERVKNATYTWYIKYIDILSDKFDFTKDEKKEAERIENKLSKHLPKIQAWVIKYTIQNNLSYTEIAEKSGTKKELFQAIVNGRSTTEKTLDLAIRFCKTLELTIKEQLTLLGIINYMATFSCKDEDIINKKYVLIDYISNKLGITISAGDKARLVLAKRGTLNKTELPGELYKVIVNILNIENSELLSNKIYDITDYRIKEMLKQ